MMEDSTVDKIDSFMQDVQYRSLMINSANFNVRLMKERKNRLPFLDTQTGIAQKPSKQLLKAKHRMPGIQFGQIYIYPSQRWCRKKRSYISLEEQQNSQEAATAVENTIVAVENPAVPMASEDSNSYEMKNPLQPEMFYYEETQYIEDDEDEQDNDDDDTYSTRSRKRKKLAKPKPVPKPPRGRRKKEPSNYKIITDADDDNPGKPYECTLCGARYKTRQGLSYHLSHTHRGNNNSSNAVNNSAPNVTVARPMNETPHNTNPTILHQPLYPMGEAQPEFYPHHMMPKQFTPIPQGMVAQPMKPLESMPGLPNFQDSWNSNYMASPQDLNNTPVEMKTFHEESPKPFEIEKKTDVEIPSGSNIPVQPTEITPPPKKDKRATPNQYCDFCLGTADYNNKTGEADEMVSCADCGRSGHLTCLQFTANMVISVKQYPWQCLECKCCTLCGTSENDDKLLFCDDCDRGYHLYCLENPLSEPPEGEWSCKLCQIQFHGDSHP